MINASEAREDDEEFKNPVDLMFDELEEREPEHFAVKQYKKYKLAAGAINNENIAEPPRNRQKQRKGGLIYESEINDTV